MLETNSAIKFIEKQKKPVSFEEIWEKVKKETIESLGKEFPEKSIKSDLYFSLIEDERAIMIGNNVWDLKSRHSLNDVLEIEKSLTEEVELEILEESDDTKELKMKIIKEEQGE